MKKTIYLVHTSGTGNTRYFVNSGVSNIPETTSDFNKAKVFTSKKAAYEEIRKMPKAYKDGWNLAGIF